MKPLRKLWDRIQYSPSFMRKANGWLLIFWVIMAFPSMIFWANSVPYLVGVSVYAIVAGHWSAWQAARTEVKQEEEEEKRDNGG
jgi:hypothetical protein